MDFRRAWVEGIGFITFYRKKVSYVKFNFALNVSLTAVWSLALHGAVKG